MPVSGSTAFSNANYQSSGAQFSQSDLLKFIQQNGSKILWREITGLDSVTKKGKWPGGKQIGYHLTVDPGGLAFGGLNSVAGTFMPADRAYGIQGFMVPKWQTFTMYFDNIMGELTDADAKAYISSVKLETEQKTLFQKSFFNLQQLMDGSGRVATPVGLGSANTATGTSFTLTNASTLLKVKLSSADTATGGAPYLMEGMIVSIAIPNYDTNNDGTAESTIATAAMTANYLALGFQGTSGSEFYYDAFRVVRIDQDTNDVYLAPARSDMASRADKTRASGTCYTSISGSHYVQQGASSSMWTDGTSTVTCTPYLGRTFALGAPTVSTAFNLSYAFNASALTSGSATTTPTACFLVLTGYMPTGTVDYGLGNTDFSTFSSSTYTAAQAGINVLGCRWDANVNTAYTADTEVSMMNPYLMTGLDSLLFNKTNKVHGIPRYSIQQILPTEKNLNGQGLTFNSMFSGLASHVTRNRDKKPTDNSITAWNLLAMNPLVYTSLLSLSEADRRITDENGIRGTGAKVISFGNKKYEMDQCSWMRMDRIIAIPKGGIEMYGGSLDPVTADGQKQFLSLNSSGQRTNAVEQYFKTGGETCVQNLRDFMFMRNFSINIL